jgi:hypothetical protein
LLSRQLQARRRLCWAAAAAASDFPDGRAILPAMKRPREVIAPRWGVYLLKRKAERLPFTVTGRNTQEAIERAVKEYDIAECERSGKQEAGSSAKTDR